MKRLYRALALGLLLALVLSAFGMFSIFAAEDGENASASFTTIMDMDGRSSVGINNVGNGKPNYPKMVKSEEDGQTKWTISYATANPGDAANGDDWWNVYTDGWQVKVRDDAGSADRSTNKEGGAKNTDYIIMDFDVSTDSEFINEVWFNCRLLKSGATAEKDIAKTETTPKIVNTVSNSGSLPAIRKTSDGSFAVCNSGGKNLVYPVMPLEGKWADVTIIYDFTHDDKNYAYVYIDGYYCGQITAFGINTAILFFMRAQTTEGSDIGTVHPTTNFSNFTIKGVPAGYTGLMTEDGVLANLAMPLSNIPELAYCLEDVPGEGAKVADIERGGETIPVYSVDDITADLQNGDTVKLYQKLTEQVFVAEGASVTILDMAGNDVTANYVNYIPAGTKWIAINGSDITYNSESATADSDPFYASISDTAKTKLILLEDYTTYGAATSKTAAKGLTIDLNGHKLTVSANSNHYVSTTDGTAFLIKNGSLAFSGAKNLGMINNQNAVVHLENMDEVKIANTIFDQRGGALKYKGCYVTGTGSITDLKSSGTKLGTLIVEDTRAEIKGTSPVGIYTIASSGKRQGSMDCFLTVKNSFIGAMTKGSAISATVYANQTGTYADNNTTFTPSADYAENDNNISIKIADSEIYSASSTAIRANAAGFTASNSLDVNECFSLDVDIEIVSSKITGTHLYEQACGGYADTLQYKDNYTYDTRITLSDVFLVLSNADKALVSKASKLAKTTVALDIAGELTAPSNDIAAYVARADGVSADNDSIALAEGGSWILRSLPEIAGYYTYTTAALDSHSYVYNEHEYEFYAYVGDPVNESNIPVQLPEESSLLAYRWEYNIDGAYEAIITYKGVIKANVTASDSLALNVYLPDNFGAEAYDRVFINGNRAEVYDVVHDGVAYKAVTVPGIDPLSATKDFKIKFRVVDENATVADVTCYVSVLDYIEAALKSDTVTAAEKTLVASLLNYIAKAEQYGSMNGDNSMEVKALLDSSEYGAIVLPTPATGAAVSTVKGLGVFSGVRLALDTAPTYELLVKDGFSGTIAITYTKGGETVTETLSVNGGDVVKVALLAYELADTTVTVTYGSESGAINLFGYMGLIPESAKTEQLNALVNALCIYSAAADAYKN